MWRLIVTSPQSPGFTSSSVKTGIWSPLIRPTSGAQKKSRSCTISGHSPLVDIRDLADEVDAVLLFFNLEVRIPAVDLIDAPRAARVRGAVVELEIELAARGERVTLKRLGVVEIRRRPESRARRGHADGTEAGEQRASRESDCRLCPGSWFVADSPPSVPVSRSRLLSPSEGYRRSYA